MTTRLPALLVLAAASLPAAAQNRPIDLDSLRSAGTRMDGAIAGGYAGRAVAGAGDVNGDGIDDVLVSAWDTGIFAPPGTVYLIYGTQYFPPQTLGLASADVVITGVQSGDRAGASLAGVGDVDGDGFDDFLIGADGHDRTAGAADSGRAYLVYGGPSLPATLSLGGLAGGAGVVFEGAAGGDLTGVSVAGARDVNGDGRPDLLLGGTGADPLGRNQAGHVHLVYGSNAFPDFVDLAGFGASDGVLIQGAAAVDHLGQSVSTAGRFDGDGFDDVVLGADDGNSGGPDSGTAYVVFGGNALPATLDLASLGSAGVVLVGDGATDFTGQSVSGGGDVNRDGRDDVVVGAPGYDDTGTDEGRAYVVFGSASPPTSIDLGALGAAGVTLTGVDGSDETGWAVAMGGDMNGDKRDDVLVGARQGDPNGGQSGEVYLLHGSSALPTSIPLDALSFRGVRLDGTDAGDRAGDALAFVGDWNDDGFEDFAVGARFAGGNTGEVTVVQGACNMLNANGPTGEGQTFVLTAHGTPGRQTLLLFGAFVLPAPAATGFGPFWLGNPFYSWQVKTMDAVGQWNVPITVPSGIGLSGLTVYYQLYEDPSPPFCDISQLLATPVP